MKSKKTYWFIGAVSFLLLCLLANQVLYVYDAASDQEANFNHRAQIALNSIVDEVSRDYEVCSTVSEYLGPDGKTSCNTTAVSTCIRDFRSQKEWLSVDSIIRTELRAANIDITYNFDFCNTADNTHGLAGGNTFTKELDSELTKSGLVMHLEFPSRSNYILKQLSPAFVSSVLIILLISVVFTVLFRYYKREKRNAERTREFLNNMTHEFKTPLTNIAFANSFLRRKSEEISPDKIKKYTAIIESENKKIFESSKDILELARQDYEYSDLELEDVNVHRIICELQRSFIDSNSQGRPEIALQLTAHEHIVAGKTSFIQNALSNIIDNAIKFSSGKPRISISTYNKNSSLFISIKDNGIGIPKAETRSVFEKFYRISTGDQHDVKGFGLGLSYVKMVVEQMKGSVSLRSELNAGSVFTVKLPLANG